MFVTSQRRTACYSANASQCAALVYESSKRPARGQVQVHCEEAPKRRRDQTREWHNPASIGVLGSINSHIRVCIGTCPKKSLRFRKSPLRICGFPSSGKRHHGWRCTAPLTAASQRLSHPEMELEIGHPQHGTPLDSVLFYQSHGRNARRVSRDDHGMGLPGNHFGILWRSDGGP